MVKKLEFFLVYVSCAFANIFSKYVKVVCDKWRGRLGYGSREGKGLGLKGQSCTLQIVENNRSTDEKEFELVQKIFE